MSHGTCVGLVPGLGLGPGPGVNCMHCRTSVRTALVRTCMVVTQFLHKSPKKYDPSSFVEDKKETKDVYEKVTVEVKVLQVLQTTTLPSAKNIQEVIVADNTASCKCTLWENAIGSLEEGKSYQLSNFNVQEYNSKKFISTARVGSNIKPINGLSVDHIDDVSNVIENDEEIEDVIIAAILKLEYYKGCIRCKARVEPLDTGLGHCTQEDCLALQRYDLCQDYAFAKLLLKETSKDSTPNLAVFIANKLLKDLASVTQYEAMTENLLVTLITIAKLKYNRQLFVILFTYTQAMHTCINMHIR